MTVCRFYQQGYCRNGNRCKFLHELPDSKNYSSPMTFGYRQPSSHSYFRASHPLQQIQNAAPHTYGATPAQLPSFSFTQPGARTIVDHHSPRSPNIPRASASQLPSFSFTQPGNRTVIDHHSPRTPLVPKAASSQSPSFSYTQPVDQQSTAQHAKLPSFNFNSPLSTNHYNKQHGGPVSFKFELPQTAASTPQQQQQQPQQPNAADSPWTVLTSKDSIYSGLEELKAEDLLLYQSKEPFQFGKVPVRPPPKHLCR